MNTVRLNSALLRLEDIGFDARLTLIDSAQAFQWEADGPSVRGVSGGRRLAVTREEGGLLLDGCREEDESFWFEYFDLDRDYARLEAVCADCPMALEALRALPGLRVLRQPPWETLVAFIISANNNVARIRGCVRRLIDALGEGGAFPAPDRLAEASEERLRALGMGYRARYLIGAARAVADGSDLDALKALDYEAAHGALLSLPGVGDKVADCVQLFGLNQSEAFPVDVWITRAMKICAPEARTKKEIRRAAHKMFGPDAGLIQQSLFHYARTHGMN